MSTELESPSAPRAAARLLTPDSPTDRAARNPAYRYLMHLGIPLALSLLVHASVVLCAGYYGFRALTRAPAAVTEYEASLTESLADRMHDAFRWDSLDTLDSPDEPPPDQSLDSLTSLDARPTLDVGALASDLGGGAPGGGLGDLGIGDGALTLLGTGSGAGEAGSGGFGGGFGSGGARIGEAAIWDLRVRANRVAYVVDFSGSIYAAEDDLTRELKRSVGRLAPTQTFDVIIFYASDADEPSESGGSRSGGGAAQRVRTESFMPALQPATEEVRRAFFTWIDGKHAKGRTEPLTAVKRALALQPEVVFFFSDGFFDESVVGEINRANDHTRARIYCLVFDEIYLEDTSGLPIQAKEGAARLQRIAEANGGSVKIVTGKDLRGP